MGAADTRDEILAVSAKLFETRGIGGTTMRAIAAGCSIKAASLYNHFASKDEIVAEVMHRSSAFASDRYAAIRAADLDPGARIEALMRATVESFRAFPEASRAFMENPEYVAAAPLLKPVRAAARAIDEQWIQAITDAVDAGVVRSDIEPRRMWSLVREMLLAVSRSANPGWPEDAQRLLLRGVFAAPGERSGQQ
jgi:TetR/AcrR family transcriptional regulator, cholesterol catabolism regulator